MRLRTIRHTLLSCLVALALAAPACAQGRAEPRWVAGWATSLMVPLGENVALESDIRDATLRQVVRMSIGGPRIRVRLSNIFGRKPLPINSATVGLSAGNATPAVVRGTMRSLTFGGKSAIEIPAGTDVLSDPLALQVGPGSDLTISLYLPRAPEPQTGHPGSRADSYFVRGDETHALTLAHPKVSARWYILGNVEVEAGPQTRAIVAMGDSITDGYGVRPNTNARWTDFLHRRLQSAPGMAEVAVLNAGIGGNHVRHDGLGPMPQKRLRREVLDVPGVTHLIFLEGVNDLRGFASKAPASPEGRRQFVDEMIAIMRDIVAQARARNIKVIGGTILPYSRSMKDKGPFDPAAWMAINEWIRAPGNFDGVIDFAREMADPADPTRLRPEFDNDGLHPSIAGYRAMAAAVPLDLIR